MRDALIAALRSDPYFELLDDLEEAARAPRITEDVRLTELAAKAFRKLRKQAVKLNPGSADEELHEVRKTGKKARYAAELAEPVAGKPAARVVKQAKAFQDVIGEHQDAVVAEERLRALARGVGPRPALVVGRLVERQATRREGSLDALPKAWKRLERSGKRAFA